MSLDPELIRIFGDETGERLDRMVTSLLLAEEGQAGAETIDSLFRDIHSIKGNAGMVGYVEVQQIAHAMESLLEPVRQAGELPRAVVDPLLNAMDAIRRAVAGETGVASAALARLSVVDSKDPGERGHGGKAIRPALNGWAPTQPIRSPIPSGDQDVHTMAPARVNGTNGPPASRSIRVAAGKVDRLLEAVGETVLHRRRFEHLVAHSALAAHEGIEEELGQGRRLLDELQHAVTQMRTLPLSSVTGAYPRAVRDLAQSEGKQVRLTLTGTATQLDRLILDGISETIVHLLRNAISHGIELPGEREAAGKSPIADVELSAEPRGELVAVSVRDDGRGVSAELVRQGEQCGSLAEVLAQAGVSTAGQVTELSGRGVGLDAVKRHVESLGGSLEVTTEAGRGTVMTMLLPLMLSLLHLLLIESHEEVWGLPLASVEEVVDVGEPLCLAGRCSVEVRGDAVALCDLGVVFGDPTAPVSSVGRAVVVSSSGRRVALPCARVIGEQEAIVKSIAPLLHGLPGYLGAAILPDARIALILDPAFVVRARAREGHSAAAPERHAPTTILVADDQFTVRELQRSILEGAGYRVQTAADGRAALDAIEQDAAIGLVLTDIEMPEMDGLELLAAIRRDPGRSSLPVIVLSSRGDETDRRRGAEAGADAYLVKSEFAQDRLLSTVAQLVAR